jgi:uncharacterized protein YegL
MPREGNPFDGENLDYTVERTPTVLLLDTSGSMKEAPDGADMPRIDQLNRGLELFKEEVMEKTHAQRRVDLSVITFGGGVEVVDEFTQVKNWTPPSLNPGGKTPMGDAIEIAIDRVENVKSTYSTEGISYNRPILWLLTDGKPSDMEEGDQRWDIVERQLEVGTDKDKFIFFALGMGDADVERLSRLAEGTGKPALKMKPGQFSEFFNFVSNSLESHSEASGDFDIDDQDMEWAQME